MHACVPAVFVLYFVYVCCHVYISVCVIVLLIESTVITSMDFESYDSIILDLETNVLVLDC